MVVEQAVFDQWDLFIKQADNQLSQIVEELRPMRRRYGNYCYRKDMQDLVEVIKQLPDNYGLTWTNSHYGGRLPITMVAYGQPGQDFNIRLKGTNYDNLVLQILRGYKGRFRQAARIKIPETTEDQLNNVVKRQLKSWAKDRGAEYAISGEHYAEVEAYFQKTDDWEKLTQVRASLVRSSSYAQAQKIMLTRPEEWKQAIQHAIEHGSKRIADGDAVVEFNVYNHGGRHLYINLPDHQVRKKFELNDQTPERVRLWLSRWCYRGWSKWVLDGRWPV